MTHLALWIAIAAALLGAVASAAQMSLRTASKGRVRTLATRMGAERHARVVLDDLWSHTLGVSLVRVLCNLAVVVASIVWVSGFGETSSFSWGELTGAGALAFVLIYVLGVVIPMSVAEHVGDALIVRMAAPIRLARIIAFPITAILPFIDVVVQRLAGQEEEDDTDDIEREIKSVVSEGESEGALKESERDMIEAVVEMRSKTVSETMTPRTEVEGIELTDDLEFIKNFISEAGHSRIPVYESDLDHIVGLLYAKDLLSYLGADTRGFELRPILREARFVPMTKPLMELLQEFQRDKVHMAIVLDEYGGTAGLVTIEDVMEEIVGEIRDEYEPHHEQEPEISVSAAEFAAVIDARAYIEDVNDALEDLDVAIPEGEDYDTVAGFVATELGRIPGAGEEFRKNGFLVKILEAEPTRVRRVRIEFRPPVEDAGAQAEPARVQEAD